MRRHLWSLVLLAALAGRAALADENADLDLIPDVVRDQPVPTAPTSPGDASQRLFLENAVTFTSRRGDQLVPSPPPGPSQWEQRLFLDLRKEWQLDQGVKLTLSDRFTLRADDNLAFPTHENLLNELRELYVSAEPLERSYLDLGRINLKSGVALGFNPTDFFKTRAVVDPLSVDPVVLREGRLGTGMIRGQHLWQGGVITAAFAPGLYDPTPVYSNTNLRSFDPSFDRTNSHDRFLLKGSLTLADDFAPELLFYREGNRSSYGLNLTQNLGRSMVAYLEYAGGRRASLIDEALRYGKKTGTLLATAPSVLPEDSHQRFQSDLAVGASYTTENRITFNLEYHFHEAGFSGTDWDNWIKAGRGMAATSPVARQLWFIRGYAQEQQEPLGQHSLFLRVNWVDAFVPKLDLTGFINTSLQDGSSLAQISADYYLSSQWTVGALGLVSLGSRDSQYGSLPRAASVLVKAVRYF